MSKCAKCDTSLGMYEYNLVDGAVICNSCLKGEEVIQPAVAGEESVAAAAPGFFTRNKVLLQRLGIVLGIWVIYRLLYFIPLVSPATINEFKYPLLQYGNWQSSLEVNFMYHRLYSIMVLGLKPYLWAIIYFFFFARFIPPLKRLTLNPEKTVIVRNSILVITLIFILLQANVFALFTIHTIGGDTVAHLIRLFLIMLGSLLSIAIVRGTTRVLGFPGVLIFAGFDFLLKWGIETTTKWGVISQEMQTQIQPMVVVNAVFFAVTLWLWLKDFRLGSGRLYKML